MATSQPVTLKRLFQPCAGVEEKYVQDRGALRHLVQLLKQGGYKIAMTQGVYDMFHVGHGRYLMEARNHGDVLIVGVDSDELTREMKGPTRPFDVFDQRIEILSMLWFVNIIVKRDVGEHKYDLIKLVEPDVLIMSQTTKSFNQEDVEQLAPYCREIKHLEAKAATTTTAKVLRLMGEGAQDLASYLQRTLQDYFAERNGGSNG